MTTYYLDTSVAVHALLGSAAAETWFDEVTAVAAHQVVSSRILRTELTRVLRREHLPVAKRDEVLDHVALVRLTEGVLAGAESIADHIKTLDAIHLSSALAIGAETVVVSHDVTLSAVAQGLGFDIHDPLDSGGPPPLSSSTPVG